MRRVTIRACGCGTAFLLAASLAAQAGQTVNGSQASASRPAGVDLPQVYNRDGEWTIRGGRRCVVIGQKDLSVRVQAGSAAWTMLASGKDDLVLRAGDSQAQLRLIDAGTIRFRPYRNGYESGVRVELSGFRLGGPELDLKVWLTICLEAGSEEVVCEVGAQEGRAVVRECRWPRALDPQTVDATVIPFMQGMLLPRDWPKKVTVRDPLVYGRGLYMPWWGWQQGDTAAMVILETPVDAGFVVEHPAGGPTRTQVRWLHSLGRMRYPRRARLCFLDRGNYVDLAKRYRRYAIETGRFVSLAEKITRTPLVGRMIGCPVIHTDILAHIEPASSYYKKDNPKANHVLTTFDRRAAQLRRLKTLGVDRAYVHVDGWGRRGYDNLHPDVLPPCEEAGGWDGLRRLSDTCRALGYLLALHDQYRDFYLDADSYDDNLAVLEERGNRPRGHTWFGGEQSILCPRFAPGYVARNHRAIRDHGVRLAGSYLDVFAIAPPDECYDPQHPVSRAVCLEYRGLCLDLIRSLEGIVSSEEPADWAIPHIDLVHHAPYPREQFSKGPLVGIPIPLTSLVYHDAVLVPWHVETAGDSAPEKVSSYLLGLLNAGIPYLPMPAPRDYLPRVRTMCQLHQRVGLLEMTGHEILDGTGRRQRATYADGTRVSVDLDRGTFEVTPPLGQ